jgi:uncharacterized protein DUF6884
LEEGRTPLFQNGGEWFVLSAKYGLIRPTQVIEPYNETLLTMGKESRLTWGTWVFNQLWWSEKAGAERDIVILAGEAYREVSGAAYSSAGWPLPDTHGRTQHRSTVTVAEQGVRSAWIDAPGQRVYGNPQHQCRRFTRACLADDRSGDLAIQMIHRTGS